MAQETIRVNCVESVYMDKGHPYSNQGKTSELVIHSTNSKTKHHEIQDLTLLQFDIPDEIKKHKIISASLCFNAMVDSSYNWIYGDYRTELYLMTSPGLSWEFSDDIYQSEYRKYVEYDDFLGEDSAIGSGFPATDVSLWRFHQNYPNYTNLKLPFLQMNFESSKNPEEDKLKTWNAFLEFLSKRQILISVWRTASTTGELDNTYSKITMQSSRTGNAPYLEVVVDKDFVYVEPEKTSFLDTSKEFTLKWQFKPTLYLADPMATQKSAQVRIKQKGQQETETIEVVGGSTECTIEGGRFTQAAYEWQVSVTTDDGRTATTEWQEFTTVDGTSSAKIIRPNLITLDGSAVNRFEWEHTISTASLPRGYEIQYRESDSQWQTLIDQKQTDQTYYDVPANTLPAGNLEWRVRTYNSNLTPGNWSDSASIIVRSAPPAPIITSVTSSPRPVISWQSEGQIQAEVRINDSTRSVLSAAKSYRWEDFLPDGFITVNVRVKNQFDLWSPWASAQTTIKNTPSGQITLSASVSNYAVSLSINSTYPQNYIYRDDVLIGKAVKREGVDTAFTYLDDTALGSHSYYAMGVDDQSNYQQSERITEKVSVPFGVIGELKALSWIELKRKRGSYPSHDIKRSYPVTMVYYSGNPLPVAHVSNELDASHTLEFTTDKTTADHLENLTGKTVIYKDVRGDLIIGVLVSVECSRDRATDVKLSIEETQREVVKIE